ncbi:MAG: hypothetical protein GY809_31410 [Planctomycetes bacterium]|nr:hypothetical protein [Planctomycetota bacterium]
MRRMHANYRRQAGVTVVEVVVASSLLLVALVPILKAMTTAQVTSRLVERRTQSVALAQGKLNEIQSSSTCDFSASRDETGTVLEGLYLCNVSDNEHATLKTVSVSVGYDSNENGSLAEDEVMVTLTTLIAERS